MIFIVRSPPPVHARSHLFHQKVDISKNNALSLGGGRRLLPSPTHRNRRTHARSMMRLAPPVEERRCLCTQSNKLSATTIGRVRFSAVVINVATKICIHKINDLNFNWYATTEQVFCFNRAFRFAYFDNKFYVSTAHWMNFGFTECARRTFLFLFVLFVRSRTEKLEQ